MEKVVLPQKEIDEIAQKYRNHWKYIVAPKDKKKSKIKGKKRQKAEPFQKDRKKPRLNGKKDEEKYSENTTSDSRKTHMRKKKNCEIKEKNTGRKRKMYEENKKAREKKT